MVFQIRDTGLLHAAVAPPMVMTFEHVDHKISPVEGLQGNKPSHGTANHIWLSLDFLNLLATLITDLAAPFIIMSRVLSSPLVYFAAWKAYSAIFMETNLKHLILSLGS